MTVILLLIFIGVAIPIIAGFVKITDKREKAKRSRKSADYARDYAAWVVQKNAADGVVASFDGLRMTKTELVEGYEGNANRHSLVGLTAKVEATGGKTARVVTTHSGSAVGVGSVVDDDRRVHVTVEGPQTAIVYSVFVKASYDAEARARQFVAQLNLASRQLQKG
jgi:hypothetical protein